MPPLQTPQIFTPNPKTGDLWQNCRIGLMGGSFDPCHKGHMHLALQALYKLKLDYVWWLFTPQNPLKPPLQTPDIRQRIAHAQEKFSHPKMVFSNIEDAFKTSYTFETIQKMKISFPKTDFIWVAGMDNTQSFHKWERWKDLIDEVPIAFFARPPMEQTVKQNPLKGYKNVTNTFGTQTHYKPGHIYWVLLGPTINASSTQIRQKESMK